MKVIRVTAIVAGLFWAASALATLWPDLWMWVFVIALGLWLVYDLGGWLIKKIGGSILYLIDPGFRSTVDRKAKRGPNDKLQIRESVDTLLTNTNTGEARRIKNK